MEQSKKWSQGLEVVTRQASRSDAAGLWYRSIQLKQPGNGFWEFDTCSAEAIGIVRAFRGRRQAPA